MVEKTGHEWSHAPQRVLHPVHLAPDDGEEGFAVDEDTDAVLLYDLVERAGLIGVVKVVGEARTALVADADADELRGGPGEEGAEAADGGGCLRERVSRVSEE